MRKNDRWGEEEEGAEEDRKEEGGVEVEGEEEGGVVVEK